MLADVSVRKSSSADLDAVSRRSPPIALRTNLRISRSAFFRSSAPRARVNAGSGRAGRAQARVPLRPMAYPAQLEGSLFEALRPPAGGRPLKVLITDEWLL